MKGEGFFSGQRFFYVVAAVTAAMVIALQVTLDCHSWRWPVGGICIAVPLFLMQAAHVNAERKSITKKFSDGVTYVGVCVMFGAAAVLLTGAC